MFFWFLVFPDDGLWFVVFSGLLSGEPVFLYCPIACHVFRCHFQHVFAGGAMGIEYINKIQALVIGETKPMPVKLGTEAAKPALVVLYPESYPAGLAQYHPFTYTDGGDNRGRPVLHEPESPELPEAGGSPVSQ